MDSAETRERQTTEDRRVISESWKDSLNKDLEDMGFEKKDRMTLSEAIAQVRESWCFCSRSEMERTDGYATCVPCTVLNEVAKRMGVPYGHIGKNL